MKKLLTSLCLIISIHHLSAQSEPRGRITVVIKDDKNSGLENATVELLRQKDSALVKANDYCST
jgi:hypothetical protein